MWGFHPEPRRRHVQPAALRQEGGARRSGETAARKRDGRAVEGQRGRRQETGGALLAEETLHGRPGGRRRGDEAARGAGARRAVDARDEAHWVLAAEGRVALLERQGDLRERRAVAEEDGGTGEVRVDRAVARSYHHLVLVVQILHVEFAERDHVARQAGLGQALVLVVGPDVGAAAAAVIDRVAVDDVQALPRRPVDGGRCRRIERDLELGAGDTARAGSARDVEHVDLLLAVLDRRQGEAALRAGGIPEDADVAVAGRRLRGSHTGREQTRAQGARERRATH